MTNEIKFPPQNDIKENMKKEIIKEGEIILNKYFYGREYNELEINLWKDSALEEITKFLEKNYQYFGFMVSILVLKLNLTNSDTRNINRNESDISIFVSIISKDLYCIIRINSFKISYSPINILQIFYEKILSEMNKILTKNFDGKKFTENQDFNTINQNIIDELNKYILEKYDKNLPCFCNEIHTIKKPINFEYNFKVIRLIYIPLMTSYSNDFLFSQLNLLILNN